jgi:hypothetical protein
MRRILLVMLAAAGLGLAGTAGASAAPANGQVITDTAAIMDIAATQVGWHGRWRSHYRWGSRRWWPRRRWWG